VAPLATGGLEVVIIRSVCRLAAHPHMQLYTDHTNEADIITKMLVRIHDVQCMVLLTALVDRRRWNWPEGARRAGPKECVSQQLMRRSVCFDLL